jgi:hypothetical protein
MPGAGLCVIGMIRLMDPSCHAIPDKAGGIILCYLTRKDRSLPVIFHSLYGVRRDSLLVL